MTDSSLEGRCFCGALRYRVAGAIRNLCLCHCESCRRAAGAPFVAWGSVNREDFTLLQGELSRHASSPGVERGFCQHCGTTISYQSAVRAGDIDFTLASLDDPEAVRPKIQIFTEDRLAWIETNPDLPQYQTVPGKDD